MMLLAKQRNAKLSSMTVGCLLAGCQWQPNDNLPKDNLLVLISVCVCVREHALLLASLFLFFFLLLSLCLSLSGVCVSEREKNEEAKPLVRKPLVRLPN